MDIKTRQQIAKSYKDKSMHRQGKKKKKTKVTRLATKNYNIDHIRINHLMTLYRRGGSSKMTPPGKKGRSNTTVTGFNYPRPESRFSSLKN